MTRRVSRLSACLLGAALAWPGAAQADWLFKKKDYCGDCYGGHCKNRSIKQPFPKIDNCAQIPPGAQPAPPGTYVNRFIQVQQATAETDDFVLYRHMWYRGGSELGPLGRYQLDLISRRLQDTPFPVVIATAKNDALDEARRDVVVSLLKARGYTDETRVIVAYPIAEGLLGDEAPRIQQGILFGGFFNDQGGLFGGGFGFGGLGGFGGFGGGFGF